MSLEDTIAAHLATYVTIANGAPIDLVVGVNLFTGPERQNPSRASETQRPIPGAVSGLAVFVLETEGESPEVFAGGDFDITLPANLGNWPGIYKPAAQITTRSGVMKYDSGKVLADFVTRVVDRNPPAGYLECAVLGNAPAYIQMADQDRHIWTTNIDLLKCK